jgi:hypothetical protein
MQKTNKANNYTGINQLYKKNVIMADRILWGRQSNSLNRRGFLKNSGLIAMSTALGMSIPFARYMPAGLIPAVYAAENAPTQIEGKEGLIGY